MIGIRRLAIAIAGGAALLGAAFGQPALSRPATAIRSDVAVAPAPPARPRDPVGPQVSDLRRDLGRIVDDARSRDGQYSVLVVSLEHGDTLFSLNPDLPLAPASNMKLYTTAAALYYLGPEFRYSTYALADGLIDNGILHGDLVLYGTGDPTMTSRMLPETLAPLRALADSLAAIGVTEIQGDVVGDGSYFDDVGIGPGWRERYRLATYSAPVGALALGESIVSVRILPGATGEPARVRTSPETDGLLVQNHVTTVSGGRSSVHFSYDPDGLLLEGRIARGHPGVARTVTVVDPANFAAAAFKKVLEEKGVRVAGGVRTIHDPALSPIRRGGASGVGGGEAGSPARVIGTHLSPTLAEIIKVTNHVSQNLYAESMFKTVGRVALGEGSFASGAQAVQYFLDCEKPVDLSVLNIVDGSGLSPLDRVTARTTVHLLDLMTHFEVWDEFYDSLPEAATRNGIDHSLRNRMGGTAAAHNLHAKTGTISNVSSLSGYVHAANGELLAFSILSNDVPSTWRAKRMEDALGARLARFTRPEPLPGVAESPRTDVATAPAAEESADSAGGATASVPEPPAVETRSHTVVSGETLDGIARRYDTTITAIETLNPGIEPRRLQIGQVVIIPPE